MKTLISCLAIITLMIANSGDLSAQEWEKINPDGVETLKDTTLLRAVVVTIEPGETIGPVTHPAHFAYVMKGGKLKAYWEEKEPTLFDLKKGMSLYMDPQPPHRTENIGDSPVSFMIVELKEHPYQSLSLRE